MFLYFIEDLGINRKFLSGQYCSCSPQIDSTFIVASFEHQVTINSPLRSPTVFNQPVIGLFRSITD